VLIILNSAWSVVVCREMVSNENAILMVDHFAQDDSGYTLAVKDVVDRWC